MILKYEESQNVIKPIEAGSYPAKCYGVVGIGTQENPMGNPHKQLILLFEIPDETIEIDGKQMPRGISKIYTASLNEKATFRKDLASWRGKDFTDEELEGFDTDKLLGVPCMITIVNKEKGDRVYSNVAAISKLPKSTKMDEGTVNGLVSYDVVEEPKECHALECLPEWIQKKCRESFEWAAARTDEQKTVVEETMYSPEGDMPF